jgi:undecaprenyl-diphosphatase
MAAFPLRCPKANGRWFPAAALLIMVSGVYVGTHDLIDMLGGALTGFAGALPYESSIAKEHGAAC